MNRKKILFYYIAAGLLCCACVRKEATSFHRDDDSAQKMVQDYMWRFPQSQLCDLYKFCFQDVFGVEHILSDSMGAVRYIEYELSNSDTGDWRQNMFVYPLTLEHNYVRVDINYVRQGIIPVGTMVSAMLQSVDIDKSEKGDMLRQWPERWNELLAVIETVTPRPLNYEEDKAMIDEVLRGGGYAVHHSRLYNATYHQHYRIIRRDVFDRMLAPLIQNGE